jgi:hypothetical protein
LILFAALIGTPAFASVVVREEIKPAGSTLPVGQEPSLTIWTGDAASLDMYYVGHDGNLWTSWYDGNTWQYIASLGEANSVSGHPVSASANGWEFTLWGTDATVDPTYPVMYEFYDPGSGFGRGPNIGAGLLGIYLMCASWDGYGLDVFFYSSDGTLVHKVLEYGSMQWTGEDRVTQDVLSATMSSAIYVPQYGITYLFGRDGTGEFVYSPYWGQSDITIEKTGLMIDNPWTFPGVVWANGKLHVFWTGTNEHMLHAELGTGTIEDLGGNTDDGGSMGSPRVVSRGDNRIDIVFWTTAARYYHWVYIDDGYSTSTTYHGL